MIKRKYECVDGLWSVEITNGKKGLKVKIEGMENKIIAQQQAKDRIRKLQKAGLIESEQSK